MDGSGEPVSSPVLYHSSAATPATAQAAARGRLAVLQAVISRTAAMVLRMVGVVFPHTIDAAWDPAKLRRSSVHTL